MVEPTGPSLEGALDAALDCVHCGLCLESCPTYRVTGLEAESPRGRIYLMRAFAEGRATLAGASGTHLDHCLGCRACETVCPAGVRYDELRESVNRARAARGGGPARPALLGRALDVVTHPRARRLLLGAAALYDRSGLRRLARRAGLVARLGPRLRMLESLAPQRGRVRAAAASTPSFVRHRGRARRGHAVLFRGCVADDLFPDVTAAAARLLTLAGYDVSIPVGQACCGALDHHAGRDEHARSLGRRNLAALLAPHPTAGPVDVVVTTSAGCGALLRELDRLFVEPAEQAAARALALHVRDVTEVLAPAVAELGLGPLPLRVTYDAPCHLLHAQRVAAPPLALLRALPGIDFRPLAGAELCCGGAGLYNVLYPDLARAILEEKVAAIRATGAEVVATGNPGCALHLAAGLREAGLPIEVVHVVTLLDRASGATAAAG